MDFPKTTPRHSFEFALWTAEQLAEFLNVKRRRIYELVREGRMPSIRIGRTLRFDPGQIQAWLGQRSSAKAAPERGPTQGPRLQSEEPRRMRGTGGRARAPRCQPGMVSGAVTGGSE